MVSLAGRGVGRSQSLTEKTDRSPGHEMNLRETGRGLTIQALAVMQRD